MTAAEAPLAGARVLDLADASADAVTRLFADLGADVLKIEPPGGSPARSERPILAGASISFSLHNANKRCAVLDSGDPADRELFLSLAAGADIVVDTGIPGRAAEFGVRCAELADRFEHLVVLSVTDFGLSGPRASWLATDPVFYALSTALSRPCPPLFRAPGPPPENRCCPPTASRRRPPRYKPPGPHLLRTITDYVVEAEISSISPGSKPWCRLLTRPSAPWVRVRWRRAMPATGEGGLAIRTSIPSSLAGTATCGPV